MSFRSEDVFRIRLDSGKFRFGLIGYVVLRREMVCVSFEIL